MKENLDANNYCKILTLLEMEEEGDPVAKVIELLSSQNKAAPPERKIVQIARLGDFTACVDSDGCAWELRYRPGGDFWDRLPPLPQDDA